MPNSTFLLSRLNSFFFTLSGTKTSLSLSPCSLPLYPLCCWVSQCLNISLIHLAFPSSCHKQHASYRRLTHLFPAEPSECFRSTSLPACCNELSCGAWLCVDNDGHHLSVRQAACGKSRITPLCQRATHSNH